MADLIDAKLIDGTARTVREMFTGRKYGLDFYQREYTWTETNVGELLDDLANSFIEDYEDGDTRSKVAGYRPYFLGPVVTSKAGNVRYLVDGQQRLTSLTLLLIYLNHLSRGRAGAENLAPLVYSSHFGELSFNIDVDDRVPVMQAILNRTAFDPTDASDTQVNIWERYKEIAERFPEELATEALLHFVDWLLERVVLVEIGTTDQDMALEIFETMNDRGLRLSNTDMLKSFLIARMEDPAAISSANALWRARVEELNSSERNADGEFIKSWLRGKYADTIRERKKDAVARDFDLIGTAFHKWARDNRDRLGLNKAGDFTAFVNTDFERMSRRYMQLMSASTTYTPGLEAVFYNAHNGVTLQLLPIMAAVTPADGDAAFREKSQLIASYLDLMVARRMVNYRNFGYSTIAYTMFNLAKDLRDRDPDDVRSVLADRVAGMEETFDGVVTFGLTQRNRAHIAYLLARMTDWLEEGHGVGFAEYVNRMRKSPFEVEHIWANHHDRHTDEFDNAYDFADKRNRFGGLLLLPKDFNASYGDNTYQEKLPHYFGQNVLARSLNPTAYENNPTFLALTKRTGLPFKSYADGFTAASIDERQDLYRLICEQVWSADRLGLDGGAAPGSSRDFYVSFGHGDTRRWDDARTYGYVSAGGGRWYTQSLQALKPGDRVFACIPGKGYVGVGVVREPARPLAALEVTVDGGIATLRHAPVTAPDMWHDLGDPEREEHGVKVDWLTTLDISDAIWEAGMFANQNSACRLRHEFTHETLIARFRLADDAV
jgi:uncharacterized protein with ParB-like and HNH nuclease domain